MSDTLIQSFFSLFTYFGQFLCWITFFPLLSVCLSLLALSVLYLLVSGGLVNDYFVFLAPPEQGRAHT